MGLSVKAEQLVTSPGAQGREAATRHQQQDRKPLRELHVVD